MTKPTGEPDFGPERRYADEIKSQWQRPALAFGNYQIALWLPDVIPHPDALVELERAVWNCNGRTASVVTGVANDNYYYGQLGPDEAFHMGVVFTAAEDCTGSEVHFRIKAEDDDAAHRVTEIAYEAIQRVFGDRADRCVVRVAIDGFHKTMQDLEQNLHLNAVLWFRWIASQYPVSHPVRFEDSRRLTRAEFRASRKDRTVAEGFVWPTMPAGQAETAPNDETLRQGRQGSG